MRLRPHAAGRTGLTDTQVEEKARETIRLPKLDQDMTDGHLLEWLVAPGARVVKDQPLAVIETDKVSTELTSPIDGVVVSIFVPAGEDAAVGASLAEVAPDDSGGTDERAGRSHAEDAHTTRRAATPTPQAVSPPSATPLTVGPPSHGAGSELAARANAMRIPLERDWARPHRSTPRARYLDEASGPSTLGAAPPLRPTQRATITVVERSWQIPQFSARAQISAGRLIEVLSALKLSYGQGISLTHLLVKLAAEACREVPQLNARYEEGQRIQLDSVDVNLLVAVGDDLLNPRIEDVCRKSLQQVAAETAAIIEACRNRTVKREELALGSFTVSNLGMYDIDDFTPLLFPPQVAILGIGRVTGEPASFHTTLVVDHRALNGVHAARYLGRFRSLCEEPLLLL